MNKPKNIGTMLARMREVEHAATPGPWEADGGEVSQHWSRPEPWETVVSTDVACMAYCYGGSAQGIGRPEDAEFIAQARTWLPRLLDAVEAVAALHQMAWSCGNPSHTNPDVGCPDCALVCTNDMQDWPCETAATLALIEDGER